MTRAILIHPSIEQSAAGAWTSSLKFIWAKIGGSVRGGPAGSTLYPSNPPPGSAHQLRTWCMPPRAPTRTLSHLLPPTTSVARHLCRAGQQEGAICRSASSSAPAPPAKEEERIKEEERTRLGLAHPSAPAPPAARHDTCGLPQLVEEEVATKAAQLHMTRSLLRTPPAHDPSCCSIVNRRGPHQHTFTFPPLVLMARSSRMHPRRPERLFSKAAAAPAGWPAARSTRAAHLTTAARCLRPRCHAARCRPPPRSYSGRVDHQPPRPPGSSRRCSPPAGRPRR